MAPHSSSASRHVRLVVVVVVLVTSVALVAEIVALALTPKQVKSITETAHDFADDMGFNGIGDWILERGSLDGENGMDTEHEGEFGHLMPAPAGEGDGVVERVEEEIGRAHV